MNEGEEADRIGHTIMANELWTPSNVEKEWKEGNERD
jgi:hypothetical protein